MSERWLTCLQLLKAMTPANVYQKFVGQMHCSQEDATSAVLEVPTSAFWNTVVQEMGVPLRDAMMQAWQGKVPNIKFVYTDMLVDNTNAGQVSVSSSPGSPAAQATNVVRQPIAQLTPVVRPTNFESHLIKDYTFDSYCEGISNRAAVNMARAMAENPDAQTFNPFFLYGPSGVGKTHLVNAVGNAVREKYPDRRVLFVSARNFQVQYADAAMADKNNKNSSFINSFIHFYQSIDMLIIDDFQEISGEKTLKAFFHIFNHLHANGRKMLFTSDRSPAELKGLEDRILSRLRWGITIPLEQPDRTLRRDIIECKLRRDNVTDFPKEVVDYLAEVVSENARELYGMVNSIIAESMKTADSRITVEMAQRVVPRIVNQARKELTFREILELVCTNYEVKTKDVCSKSRKSNITAVRHIVCYLGQKFTASSLSQIGRELGGRDHTTILHSCKKIEKMFATDANFREEIENIEVTLRKN